MKNAKHKLRQYCSDRDYRMLVTGNLSCYARYHIKHLSRKVAFLLVPCFIPFFFLDRFYRRKLFYNLLCATRQEPLLSLRQLIQSHRSLNWFYKLIRLKSDFLQVLSHVKLIKDSKLFSKSFYEEQCNRRFASQSIAIMHFLLKNGRCKSPHPLFDTLKYLETYPALNEYHHTPIIHYLTYGFRETYIPHPAFDVHYYCSQSWYDAGSDINPLQHYIENATKNLDINPNRYFNTRHYIEQNPDCLKENRNPLEHWLSKGTSFMPHFDNTRDAFVSGKKEWDVILFSHEASRTGAPMVVLHLSRYFKEYLNMCCLIITERGGTLEDDFLKYADLIVLAHHWRQGCSAQSIGKLLQENISNPPQHIIVNSVECYRSMKALHGLQLPFVLLMHEFGDYYPFWYLNNVRQWSSHIIFPAEIVKNSMKKKLKKDLAHTSVRPQGYLFNQDSANKTIARREIRRELGVADNSLIFMGCGTITPRKGCDHFVNIAHEYQKSNPNKPYIFIWIGDPVGQSDNNYYMNKLNNMIQKNKLNKNIRFIGSRANIHKYFQAADVFLLTSRLDPFPYVVMHAMEYAVPVICFRETTGAEYLFSDGKAGFSVNKFNVSEAADKLRLYVNNEKLRITSGENARHILENSFTYKDYAQHILETSQKIKNTGVVL